MPIKPENRSKYPKDWIEISLRVRAEAGQRCENCKVCNGARGYRHGQDLDFSPVSKSARASISEHLKRLVPGFKFLRIVLTVHHIDGNPSNSVRSNLIALCQRCHLAADRDLRKARKLEEDK